MNCSTSQICTGLPSTSELHDEALMKSWNSELLDLDAKGEEEGDVDVDDSTGDILIIWIDCIALCY